MGFTIVLTLVVGAVFALFGWRRSSAGLKTRLHQLFNDLSTNFGERLMKLAHCVFHNVAVPLAQFVRTVYQEVKHNLSEPAPTDVELQVRGGSPLTSESGPEGAGSSVEAAAAQEGEGESAPLVEGAEASGAAPPQARRPALRPAHKSFAQFCAALISSLISTALALAYEISKLIPFVFSSRHRAETLLRMDVYDEPDAGATTVELDAPGVAKDGMDISLYEGWLTVSCDAPSGAVPLGRFYHRRERPQGRLSRTIRVPAGTKVEDLHANMEHGVLKISFPMSSTHRPEKIAIN